jgi:hypothetical protein
MSYLRPTCSDAAVRVTNLNLSRCLPIIWQGDAQIEHIANAVSQISPEDFGVAERLPSRRPLDRRWDESRGLVFLDRAPALRSRIWTPARGIPFTANVSQRRSYAMRPTRVAPVAPKLSSSTPDAGPIYGSDDLPSLERQTAPSPAMRSSANGIKQEQMENDLRQAKATINTMEQGIKSLRGQIQALKAELHQSKGSTSAQLNKQRNEMNAQLDEGKIALRKAKRALENAKQEAHSEGISAGKIQAREEMQAEMRGYESKHIEMQEQVREAQARYPEMKKDLEADLVRREDRLRSQLINLTQKERAILSKANDFDAEVRQNAKEINRELEERSTELEVMAHNIRTRSLQRSDYTSYRNLYKLVHEERKILADRLKTVNTRLERERSRLKPRPSQDAHSNATAPPELQLMLRKIEDWQRAVEIIRKNTASIDNELSSAAHKSRLITKATRFHDTRVAAHSMSQALYLASITPLRTAKDRTQADIEEIAHQIENANNATTREELKYQSDALIAEKMTITSALDLAYLDRSLQVFETLKWEPYVHKAVYLATFDVQTHVDKLSNTARAEGAAPGMLQFWERLRNTISETNAMAKKRALLLEIMGKHKEHEKRLDELIDKKVIDLTSQLQQKRTQLFGYHKSARAAAKRASTRVVRSVPSSRLTSTDTSLAASGEMSKQAYHECCLKLRELRSSLKDDRAALDPERRVEILHQYNTFVVEQLEHTIAVHANRLRGRPRTRPDIVAKKRSAEMIGQLESALAKAQKRLREGTDLFRDSSRSRMPGTTAADGSKTPESFTQPQTRRRRMGLTGQQRRVDRSLKRVQQRLADSSLSDADRDRLKKIRETATLRQLRIQIDTESRALEDLGSQTVDNAAEYGARTRNITLMQGRAHDLRAKRIIMPTPPEDLKSPSASENSSASPDGSTVSGTKTESHVIYPGSKGLNLSATSAIHAAHQPASRRELHDNLLWSDFVRRQELRQGSPSPVTVAKRTRGTTDQHIMRKSGVSHVNADAARDRDDGKSRMQAQAGPASLVSETPNESTSYTTTDTASIMAESDETFLPTFEISSKDKKNALIASRNSTASFWRYSLYKNAAGEIPTRYYCTTFEQTENQIAKFSGEKVVGFDLEWERFKSKPGEDSAKRCVSLVQIAAENKVALFHLAMFRGGDSAEELMPPSLRAFLENPKIIKAGVNIGGDATRLRTCFGVEMQGNIELSHLYKLVTYGESDPSRVNRGLYSLANQVTEVLHLPLAKGAVRTSSWSKRLDGQQTEYAVSDAYAGLRLYYELERRRKAMESKPPRPAFHELGLPILLGGGQEAPAKPRRGKQAAESSELPEELVEESAALQEQDDGDVSEDSENIYDDPEELEAFEAYLESQDAEAVTGACLPEITYPTLPPLEDFLSPDVDDTSSLPSDPIAKPSTSSRTPTLHSPEAVTADAWATAWQAQLPATYNVRVSQPHLRAYHLWHHQGFDIQETAALLRKEPLALSTVVRYIAEVVQKEDLEFDAERMREVRAKLPASVRGRYAKLYANAGAEEA